jgi:hypothetical protein
MAEATESPAEPMVAAGQAYAKKVTAFNQAKEEATRAGGIRHLSGKKYIHATEFTKGVGGHLIDMQKNTLKAQTESRQCSTKSSASTT